MVRTKCVCAKKTKLCASEVEICGTCFDTRWSEVGQENVKAVIEMAESKSVENIQALLGIRQIIKDSSTQGFKFY